MIKNEVPLKRLRLEKGWTREQLSEASGIHANVIGRIERGEREFKDLTVQTAIRLAEALGVTVEDLFSGANVRI